MRFQHADTSAKGVVESIPPRLDPEHDPDDRELKKKMRCGTPALENAIVMMAVLLVTAQFVVVSSRVRQTMMRLSSPR
jgi:hypothetical protein